ncbi:DNA-binding transcriptional ArsR family regulator [Microbacterium laevaniformans]|uniref:Transcriptional repressor SdpR n=1 Tax=Microbacterium laevaniformans TaxID=36807 RepID=A0A150HIS2_9MICO|nr:metalloregulator ArsR/SmtB family transcription factor [Microbacterium laevaniformans]KXZ61965.1 Transcriptional repressor SdpR [Microbacterium laevaniformans]MBM7753788.1 DNA-binding transcriptional ArsR family regulator [Microbacterium laevaniformans]
MTRRTHSLPVDRVLAALANPTRREVLDLLLDGPRSASDIAAQFDMARPSVSEHLRELRESGLVTETRDGRYRRYSLNADPLTELHDWLTPYERFWRGRLTGLGAVLDAMPDEDGGA